MGIKKEYIKVYGMTCTSCEQRITRTLKNVKGVLNAKASYSNGLAEVEYDEDLCDLDEVKEAVKKAGYSTKSSEGINRILGIVFIMVAIILLGKLSTSYDMSEKLNNATYFMLLIVGLISSLHCVGMCGGIMLSQSIAKEDPKNKFEALQPALLYNVGRVISYTILGGFIGAVGSVFSLSLGMKAALQIFAGLFMIIMGLNMTGLSWFRKIHIRLPWSACSIKERSKAPFIVGLLNGFMPCGPLQTMQLFALGTGSAVKGAASMFFFSIGTVPLMLTFGAISGLLSSGYTRKLLKFSGIMVIVLGIVMGNRGLALAGINFPHFNHIAQNESSNSSENNNNKANIEKAAAENNVQIINMKATASGYTPSKLQVEKGVAVKWIITGEQITTCNNTIVVPSLKIQKTLKSGENIIEFTPNTVGDIKFSCSMGMIRGVITVVEKKETPNNEKAIASTAPSSPSPNEGKETTASIYGDDLKKVDADRLVKKAILVNNVQRYIINGRGYEFDPLIVVVNKGIKARITVDLSGFKKAEGKFDVIEGNTGKVIYSFDGTKGLIEFDVPTNKIEAFGITKDGELLGVIDVIEDIDSADLTKIKDKYVR